MRSDQFGGGCKALIEFIWLLYLEGKSDFSQTVQRIYPFDLNDCIWLEVFF